MPEPEAEQRSGHSWVLVIVTSPRTSREARRFLEGERLVFKKLDMSNAEDVRSASVMCAVCKLAPESPDDMLVPCPGEPLPGKSNG